MFFVAFAAVAVGLVIYSWYVSKNSTLTKVYFYNYFIQKHHILSKIQDNVNIIGYDSVGGTK